MRRLGAAALLAVAVASAAVPALGATKKRPRVVVKSVTVADDYYSPTKLTVGKGTEIKWSWSSSNYDSHNVTLRSGPRGTSRHSYSSITGVYGIRFIKTLKIPGTYHFYCTLHPSDMNLTIVVKK